MTTVLVVAIVFFAAFVQTLSGFGFALIVMPLITIVMSLHTAAPLVALTGFTLCTINLVRYRQSVNIGEVLRLVTASALGIPAGLWVLTNVDESTIKGLLGLILIAYAVYAIVHPVTPRLRSRWWVYPAGFAAGCLSGAYNTPGPPVVVYGSLRQWPKDEFRAVLQTFFSLNAMLEVNLIGAVGHDVVTWEGETLSTFELAMRWMQTGRLNCERLLTHRFPLDDYRRAFVMAVDKRRYQSVKVALERRY
jgi:uncharacterized membrane protein YfcA